MVVGGLASRVVRQMSRAPTARGVVAHGAAFSKHFAAFTLEDATDVILAAKDGWGVEGLAEACDAVLAAGRAGDGDGGEVEVEIFASTSETLEDDLEPEGAACVHPTEFRARRRRGDVQSTSDAWDPWRAFRAEAPREDRVIGGADGGVPTPRPPRKNRNARKNENRASAFAALLVRAFGLETLRAGAGVVDVAGGSGELALELVTRWAVPCCVVDPRGDGAKITARHRRLLASRERNAALVSDAWKAESALARSLARRWTARTSRCGAPRATRGRSSRKGRGISRGRRRRRRTRGNPGKRRPGRSVCSLARGRERAVPAPTPRPRRRNDRISV